MDDFETQINEVIDINQKLLKSINELYNSDEEISLIELNTITNITSKISSNLSSIFFKIEEMKNKEDIDFNHPKIQRGLMFLTQVFLESMKDSGVSDDKIEQVFNDLSIKLTGFEDRLNRTLRTTKSHMIEHTINPLVKKSIKGE